MSDNTPLTPLTRRRTVGIAVFGATALLTLAACGSDSAPAASTPDASAPESASAAATTTAAAAGAGAGKCPNTAPASDAAPSWKLQGTQGSIAVVGPTPTTAPRVDVTGPFSVAETTTQTLTEGSGAPVSASAAVLVCYQGVNGRDGSVFDSAYERALPVRFPLANVVPGFQKAITGQKVGSTVAVAVAPADGYPDGQPAAGIEGTDTLVFTLTILDATG